MSSVTELFAARFVNGRGLSPEAEREMADELGCDSLRYLPVEAISRAIAFPPDHLCQACITGRYPTEWGQKLYQIALEKAGEDSGIRAVETLLK